MCASGERTGRQGRTQTHGPDGSARRVRARLRSRAWIRSRGRDRERLNSRSRTRFRHRAGDRDRGQTAIEFVGVTPLIILLFVALWQCALLGFTYILAGNAADVGARVGTTATQGVQDKECARAAKEDLPSGWSGDAGFDCHGGEPGLYRAKVTLKVPVLVPGLLSWNFSVEGNAASVKES